MPFWVGGAGNWSDATNHWAAVSGGAPGAGNLPTSATDAVFDANSNPTAYTVTIDTTAACLALNVAAAPSVSGTVTLTGASANSLSVHGVLTLLAGMTWSLSGALIFRATSGTKALTFNGVILTGTPVSFNGSGGTFQLADALTITSPSNGVALAMTAGTFDPNGKTVTLNGVGVQISGAFTFFNLTRSGPAGSKLGTLSLTADIAVTGTLTVTGNSATDRVLVSSSAVGTVRTVTAAAVALTNVDFMDIAGAGVAAPFTGTSLGDALGNSGITMTPSVTQTATGTASFTWSTHGWTTRVPLPQDDVVIPNAFVAGRTVTCDMPRIGRNITFTCTGNPAFTPTATFFYYGSFAFAPGMTTTSGFSVGPSARSAVTFTSAGVAMTLPLNCSSAPGISCTLQDALSCSSIGALVWRTGTFNDGGFSVTVAGLDMQNTSTKALVKSGTWTLTGTAGVLINGTGTTITDSAGQFKFTDATSTGKTFAGAGLSFKNVWLAAATRLAITGSNTIETLRADVAPAVLQFTASTTTTLTNVTVNGTTATGGDEKFGQMFGTSGGYFSTPDSAAVSVTGRIGIRVKAAAADWTPTASQIFAGNGSYLFYNNISDGQIIFRASPFGGGANVFLSLGSAAAYGLVDGTAAWLGVDFQPDNGSGSCSAQPYTSTDGVTWNAFGAPILGTVMSALIDPATVLEVGATLTGTSSVMNGRIHHVEVRTGGINGTRVAVFDPDDYAGAGASSWVSTITGETWTKNGNAIVSATNQIAICSATAASHTLTKAGGGRVQCNNVSVNRSTASPGSTFYAKDSIDGGNNAGWVFGTYLQCDVGTFTFAGQAATFGRRTHGATRANRIGVRSRTPPASFTRSRPPQ